MKIIKQEELDDNKAFLKQIQMEHEEEKKRFEQKLKDLAKPLENFIFVLSEFNNKNSRESVVKGELNIPLTIDRVLVLRYEIGLTIDASKLPQYWIEKLEPFSQFEITVKEDSMAPVYFVREVATFFKTFSKNKIQSVDEVIDNWFEINGIKPLEENPKWSHFGLYKIPGDFTQYNTREVFIQEYQKKIIVSQLKEKFNEFKDNMGKEFINSLDSELFANYLNNTMPNKPNTSKMKI